MNKDLLPSFLLGVGVGAVIALLCAPQSGEQTRQRIKTTANDGSENIKHRTATWKNSAAEFVERTVGAARNEVAEALAAGKQAYVQAANS